MQCILTEGIYQHRLSIHKEAKCHQQSTIGYRKNKLVEIRTAKFPSVRMCTLRYGGAFKHHLAKIRCHYIYFDAVSVNVTLYLMLVRNKRECESQDEGREKKSPMILHVACIYVSRHWDIRTFFSLACLTLLILASLLRLLYTFVTKIFGQKSHKHRQTNKINDDHQNIRGLFGVSLTMTPQLSTPLTQSFGWQRRYGRNTIVQSHLIRNLINTSVLHPVK